MAVGSGPGHNDNLTSLKNNYYKNKIMKYIQTKLLLATALITLTCLNSFGQNATVKKQNTDGNKETRQSDDLKNLLLHHLKSFQENNIAALMNDYTTESVLITQDTTYVGFEEIKFFFTNLVTLFPKEKSNFELDKMITKNNLMYIIWHAKTPTLDVPFGSDTFIIKDNKIYQQTFAGQLKFIK